MIFSGASRPILDVLFAAVVYQILEHGLTTVAGLDEENGTLGAALKVAAFLCGFSERFATEILARVPFGAERDKVDVANASAAATRQRTVRTSTDVPPP